MVQIMGVDFSGAGSDEEVKKTWLAVGKLEGNRLDIDLASPISRNKLTNILKCMTHPAVVAMDFPFSVPWDFAKKWCCDANLMTQVWQRVECESFESFSSAVNHCCPKVGKEHFRIGDLHFPECYSPLQRKGNPTMLPMTFQGMKMLGKLWETGEFNIPPLASREGRSTLLEVMPGAVIRSLGLTKQGYKGGKDWWEGRKEILDRLPGCSDVDVIVSDKVQGMCLGNDDCLDSVVAALAAALWAKDKSQFRCPLELKASLKGTTTKRIARVSREALNHTEKEAAQLEGWLYAPTPLLQTE